MGTVIEQGLSGTEDRAWLSVYLLFDDPPSSIYAERTDAIILDILAPFVAECEAKQWIERFFYLRFREDQCQVRLRLGGRMAVLRETVGAAFLEHLRVIAAGRASAGFRGPPLPRVQWVPYEPEIDRYGGADVMPLAEACFHRSSEATFSLLAASRGRGDAARLGQAALTLLAFVYGVTQRESRAVEFLEYFCTSYVTSFGEQTGDKRDGWRERFSVSHASQDERIADYIAEAWRRITTGEPISDPVDVLVESGRTLADAMGGSELFTPPTRERPLLPADARRSAIIAAASLIHMTMNRLGVTPMHEAFLADICARQLRRLLTPAVEHA
jgi:thiopeptide-type bacteriocin biosynthesis protein